MFLDPTLIVWARNCVNDSWLLHRVRNFISWSYLLGIGLSKTEPIFERKAEKSKIAVRHGSSGSWTLTKFSHYNKLSNAELAASRLILAIEGHEQWVTSNRRVAVLVVFTRFFAMPCSVSLDPVRFQFYSTGTPYCACCWNTTNNLIGLAHNHAIPDTLSCKVEIATTKMISEYIVVTRRAIPRKYLNLPIQMNRRSSFALKHLEDRAMRKDIPNESRIESTKPISIGATPHGNAKELS